MAEQLSNRVDAGKNVSAMNRGAPRSDRQGWPGVQSKAVRRAIWNSGHR